MTMTDEPVDFDAAKLAESYAKAHHDCLCRGGRHPRRRSEERGRPVR